MNANVKLLSLRFPRLSSQRRHMAATSEGAKWEHLRRDLTVSDRKHRAIRMPAKEGQLKDPETFQKGWIELNILI